MQQGEELVIVSLASSQAVSLPVERHARDDAQLDFIVSREVFSSRFFNAEGTDLQTFFPRVVTKHQNIPLHHWQEDFLRGAPFLYKGVRLHFIAQ